MTIESLLYNLITEGAFHDHRIIIIQSYQREHSMTIESSLYNLIIEGAFHDHRIIIIQSYHRGSIP